MDFKNIAIYLKNIVLRTVADWQVYEPLIRDYNSIKDTHPRVGYYYNAMCFEFLQRSLLVVGADSEQVDRLDNQIAEEFNKFKGIVE